MIEKVIMFIALFAVVFIEIIKRILDKKKRTKWINIDDLLPEEGQKVITYHDDTGIDIMKYHNLRGTKDEILGDDLFTSSNGFLTDDVTHWMSLPKEPLKGE